MTTQTPEEKRRAAKYLALALSLNPHQEADRIIATRNRFLRIHVEPPKEGQTTDDVLLRREKLTEQLRLIRERFWKMDLTKLRRRLDGMKFDEFPDLQQAAQRIQVVARERHLFGQLTQMSGFEPDFFSDFRKILVAAPKEAASIRDDVYSSIRGPRRLKAYKKMLKLIRSELPECYELESEWLSSIQRIRKVKTRQSSSGGESISFSGEGLGCTAWIVGFAILRIVLRLISMSDN